MGVIKKFASLEAHFRADAGLPAPSPAALSGGLRCFLRPSRHTSPWTSRRGSDQVPHTHQIVGGRCPGKHPGDTLPAQDRKSTRLNSSHITISYAVFCLKKKKKKT